MYGRSRVLPAISVAVSFLALWLISGSGTSSIVTGSAVGRDGKRSARTVVGGRYQIVGLKWSTIVNNGFSIPKTKKEFNSYNQPSVSAHGMVVFRGRGKGHPRATGIFTRHVKGSIVASDVDLSLPVPYPNNLGTGFNEFPSIPRISPNTEITATRASHQPVYSYILPDGSETRAGTSGIYVTRRGFEAVTAAPKLGSVPDFEFFAVPGTDPPVPFEVFPG